jgi:hypothetical protein
LWDAKDRTRGLLWRGDPLCRQVREGTGAEAHRRPLRRFPGTFTGHPPYSVRKARDLGMETREIPTNPYSAGVLGTADQGKAVGATTGAGGYSRCTSRPPRIPTRGVLLNGRWRHLLCAHQLLSAWHERWEFCPPLRRVES